MKHGAQCPLVGNTSWTVPSSQQLIASSAARLHALEWILISIVHFTAFHRLMTKVAYKLQYNSDVPFNDTGLLVYQYSGTTTF